MKMPWQGSQPPRGGRSGTLKRVAPVLVVLVLAAGAASVFAVLRSRPSDEPASDWPMYLKNLRHLAVADDSPIDTGNVERLTPAWQFNAGGNVTSTPVAWDGKVYVGAWNGMFYALDASSGREIWRFATDAALDQQAGRPSGRLNPVPGGFTLYPEGVGIDSTAAVVDGVVYVPAVATVYALDAHTGNLRWKTTVGDKAAGVHIWSSPAVADGLLYIGVASENDEPGLRGRLVALDVATGREVWSFWTVPEDADGGGIWSSPAVDEQLGLVIVGTSNPYTIFPTHDDYTDSIIALDWKTGQLRWAYQAKKNDDTDDGFGSSVILFDLEDGGSRRRMVGAPIKRATYYVLDRETGQLVWKAHLAPDLLDPNNPDKILPLVLSVGSSAYANGRIIVGLSTDFAEDPPYGEGRIVALDAATGRITWSTRTANMVTATVAIANSVAFAGGVDGFLYAVDIRSGNILARWNVNGSVASGPAIVGKRLFIGAGIPDAPGPVRDRSQRRDRHVYSFVLR